MHCRGTDKPQFGGAETSRHCFSEDYLAQLPSQKDVAYTTYEIHAPFNGTVIERHLTPGEFHKEDAAAFTLADLSMVWVKISIYQKDLPLVQKGQRVHISAGRGIPDTEGKIAYIEAGVREQTRTAVAVVVLPNPNGLFRPGLFVTCRLEPGTFRFRSSSENSRGSGGRSPADLP